MSLNEEQITLLARAFCEKHRLDPDHMEREWLGVTMLDMVMCMIIDTMMVADGSVPLEKWLPEGATEDDGVGLPADYWESAQ